MFIYSLLLLLLLENENVMKLFNCLHSIYLSIYLFILIGIYAEKKKDFAAAMDCYSQSLSESTRIVFNAENESNMLNNHNHNNMNMNTDRNINNVGINGEITTHDPNTNPDGESGSVRSAKFYKDLRGEIMLRMAVLRKEMGALDQALQMCTQIVAEQFGDGIRANTLCLKVSRVNSVRIALLV